MTDEHTTDDSTDDERQSDAERPGEERPADQRPGDDTTIDRRRFMQGAASSAAAFGGLAAVGGSARAAGGSGTTLLVVGRGRGQHSYEIAVESGGSIQPGSHAGSSDTVGVSDGRQRVNNDVWHWNVDSFTVTGDIHRIELDGSVSVHAMGGAFVDDERIAVGGESDGRHHYRLGTNSGDIDPVGETTWGNTETDHHGSNSEQWDTFDEVSGRITDQGADTHTLGRGRPVQYVRVENGHASFSAYQPGQGHASGSGSRGRASLVLFYMGDGPFTTFFQNFTDLTPALTGYDHSILLKHRNGVSGVSALAHNLADTVQEPTRENFEHCIESLTDAGYTIDLYIMSHGDRDSFKLSEGTHGSEDWYGVGDIQDLRASFEGPIPLRMVYQANCWGSELNSAWRTLGARAAAGSRFVNFFPNQFPTFAKEWKRGKPFQQALNDANTLSSRIAAKQFIKGDAGVTQGDEWGQNRTCAMWDVFDRSGGCAMDYFVDRWGHSHSEWNSVSMTGWEFAVHASEKLVAGDGSVRANFTY